ncbi:hypothetical protein [Methyloceanibacter sp.]|uniref:hypothetical protein n=1 Tax=Methyloceanibacter sp. TaxID=1965321 RepID=UPI003D6D0155
MTSLAPVGKKVGQVLLTDWDPIGICDVPQAHDEYDEYDEYVPPIARMLAKGTTAVELSDHLLKIERDTLGLKGDTERASRVAMRLLRIP